VFILCPEYKQLGLLWGSTDLNHEWKIFEQLLFSNCTEQQLLITVTY